MKKRILLLPIMILLFAMTVHASEIGIEVDCGRRQLTIGSSITCPVKVVQQGITFDKVEFSYNSSLNLSFNAVSGSTLNSNAGTVTIDMTLPVPAAETPDSTTVANMVVRAPNNAVAGTQTINFSNAKVSEQNGNSSNNVTIDPINITLIANSSATVDLTLTEIKIDGVELAGFSPTKYKYENIKVKKEIVRVEAHAKEPTKTQVTGLGDVAIDKNKATTRIITVETQDHSRTQNYELVFVYEEEATTEPVTEVAKSKDNTLKSLEIYHGEEKLDFEYDAKKTTFDYAVDGEIEKVEIKAVQNDDKAKFVSKFGPREVNLEYGKNKVELKVQAESGDIKVYTLNITRPDNRSADATLASLKIAGTEIKLEKDVYEYKTDVRYNVLESKIEATTTNPNAKVEFTDITLVDGENPPIKIKVTSEKNTTQEYTVIINRLSEAESKIVLESIAVQNYELPFNVATKSYDLEIKEEDTKLDIIVKPEQVKYDVVGNKDLVNNSVVIVRVTDDNGTESYTINIHKTVKENSSMEMICYVVFGLGLLTFILSLVYASSKKKKRNMY